MNKKTLQTALKFVKKYKRQYLKEVEELNKYGVVQKSQVWESIQIGLVIIDLESELQRLKRENKRLKR